jgi:hypothetical protein
VAGCGAFLYAAELGNASKLRPPARTPRLFGSWQVCGRSRTLSGVPFVYRRMSYGGGERGKGLASWVLTAPRPAAAAAAAILHSIGREGSIIFLSYTTPSMAVRRLAST